MLNTSACSLDMTAKVEKPDAKNKNKFLNHRFLNHRAAINTLILVRVPLALWAFILVAIGN
jgi:hypothetical protein